MIKMRFILFLLFSSMIVFSQTNYALVIGNSQYQELGSLRNPENDATDMAEALRELGFQVEMLSNAELTEMEDAVLNLSSMLRNDRESIGLFYYAGHGVQSNGVNYLIPSDPRIPRESFLKSRSLSAQIVLDELGRSGNQLNTIILDACRDNPFGWSRSGSRGLTVVGSQPPGSIIVYATSSGTVAQDGLGRNGLFTSELLNNIRTPGIDVTEVFKRTGQAVQQRSNGSQIPAVYNQFFGDASFTVNTATNQSNNSSSGITFTVEQTYGSMTVTTLTQGELYLDGQYMGQLSAGGRAAVGDIPAGRHELEIRYESHNELQSLIIREDVDSPVAFTWVEGGSNPSSLTGADDNDNFRTAYNLTFPTEGLRAGFNSISDRDFYSLIIPSGNGESYVTVKTTGDTDTMIKLYGPNDWDLLHAEDDDSGEGYNGRISFATQPGDQWWIQLDAYDESGPYNLVVEPALAAAVEDEANDSFDTAFELDLDQVTTGYYSGDDQGDYFSLQIPRRLDGNLIRRYTDNQIDTELYLYDGPVSDPLEDYLYYNDDTETYAASITFPAEGNSRLFVMIDAYEEGPYEIHFEVLDADSSPYESNDTFETATSIRLGELQTHSFFHSVDKDFIVFTVSRPGDYTIETQGDSDPMIKLYNDQFDLLQEDDDSGDNYNSLIETPLKSGTYYLEMESAVYDNLGEYQILIDNQPRR
ncbi:MAG: caspase family protein [Spirochaetaceae bacterium]|jgi:hypothetical protein|nr:caspase family protein [Spirochaetaceae bacterium]